MRTMLSIETGPGIRVEQTTKNSKFGSWKKKKVEK